MVIRNKTVEVELGPVSEAAGNMLKVYPYEDNNETYLLIENRQSIDKYVSPYIYKLLYFIYLVLF